MKADYQQRTGTVDYSLKNEDGVIVERRYELVGQVSYGGVVYLTISRHDGVLYYELNQRKLVAGSDGSVFATGEDAAFTQTLAPNEAATGYHLGLVAAEGEGRIITITLDSPTGSILDGDAVLGAADGLDIVTNNGDVYIIGITGESVGTADDPLEISTGTGRLIFLNEDG